MKDGRHHLPDATGLDLRHDAWLSEHAGVECWTVLDQGLGAPYVGDVAVRSPAFVTARVAVDDVETVRELGQRRFFVVDAALTFTAPLAAREAGGGLPDSKSEPGDRWPCSLADPSDSGAVGAIAADALTRSRFHLDPLFPDDAAKRIKAAWARNLASGERGISCLVVRDGRDVVGFLGIAEPTVSPDAWAIDLVAVKGAYQGRGMGGALVDRFLTECRSAGRLPTVGTQAANPDAARFYERRGFRLERAEYVMHAHWREEEQV